MSLTLGSLFSGIGGLDLGLECALRDGGFCVETVWQCEADAWCRGILARHWPYAVQFADVRDVGPDAPRVDVLCGGFPCQDVSYAGKGAGLAGARSGLWFEFARVVRDLRPRVVVVENVAALATRGLDAVLGSLSEAGYDAVWFDLRASDVGAPHRRERLFIVGYRRELEHANRGGRGAQRVARVGAAMGVRGDASYDTAAPQDTSARHVADTIGGRRDGRAVGAEGDHGDRTDARRSQGSDGASDGRAELADANARGWGERTSREECAGRAEPDRDDARAAGMANARGSRLERQRNLSVGARAEDARSRGERGRRAQPRLGRATDGLPVMLDAHRWPVRPGEPQRADEAPRVTTEKAPRVTTEKAHRSARLKALGNAVVPQVGYVVGCVVAEVLRAEALR